MEADPTGVHTDATRAYLLLIGLHRQRAAVDGRRRPNQAASAARDGARAGILAFARADLAGTADREVIVDAVLEKLPANTATAEDVTITCVDPSGVARPCASARLDADRIRVEVQWSWPMLSPLAGSIASGHAVAAGSASMVIVGLPTRPPTATSTTTTTTTAVSP